MKKRFTVIIIRGGETISGGLEKLKIVVFLVEQVQYHFNIYSNYVLLIIPFFQELMAVKGGWNKSGGIGKVLRVGHRLITNFHF